MQFNDIFNYITEGNFGVQGSMNLDVDLISNGIAMAYDNDIAEKKDDFIKIPKRGLWQL